jgi:ubiquinone/menaquinone biosynthesis C-methylase UbiE
MRAKIAGIALIIIGFIGMVLPFTPGIPFIIIGLLLIYKDRLAELRRDLPEEMPAFAVGAYGSFFAKVLFPTNKMICDKITLPKGSTLLDIGTGPGLVPIDIAKRLPDIKVIGIDLSSKMINLASRNESREMGMGSGRLSNLKFLVMDAKNLNLPDNSIDMVLSTGSMHHWKDPVKVFNEIYRVLKPGQEAWICDGYKNASTEAINSGLDKFLGLLPTPWIARQILGIHGYTQAEYETLVKENVSKSSFKVCSYDNIGVMMRLILTKPR